MKKLIKCLLLRADTPTNNGNIYPRDELEKAIKEFNDKKEDCLCDDMSDIYVDLTKVTHRVDKIYFDGDDVFTDITPLNAPIGKLLQVTSKENYQYSLASLSMVDPDNIVRDIDIRGVSITQKVDNQENSE